MTARERWDETRALIEAGQDTDILAPGLILFPNGGRINVHQVRKWDGLLRAPNAG